MSRTRVLCTGCLAVALAAVTLYPTVSTTSGEPSVAVSGADQRLAQAYRFARNGWIYVHLQGTPAQIGYQHGYLLAPEIEDGFRAVKLRTLISPNGAGDFSAPLPSRCFGRISTPSIRRNSRALWTA